MPGAYRAAGGSVGSLHPPPQNQPGTPESRPGRPRAKTPLRSCRSGAGRNPKLPGPSGRPHPAAGALTGGRSACPARVPPGGPAPPPAVSLDSRAAAAPPRRVPAARLARAFCGPIQQLRGRRVKLRQHNKTKQNPKDCCGLDCTPRAAWGTRVGGSRCHHSRAPGGRHSGLQDLRAQTPRSSVGPRPSKGFSWVGTRRHHATCRSLAWGTVSRAPHSEGPGSLFRTSPPSPSPPPRPCLVGEVIARTCRLRLPTWGSAPPGTPGCAGVGGGREVQPIEHAPLLLPPQEIKWEL